MKILGIAGSARKSSRSGVYRLVSTVLENTGVAFDLVQKIDSHLVMRNYKGLLE